MIRGLYNKSAQMIRGLYDKSAQMIRGFYNKSAQMIGGLYDKSAQATLLCQQRSTSKARLTVCFCRYALQAKLRPHAAQWKSRFPSLCTARLWSSSVLL